jgi:hypothetical protein
MAITTATELKSAIANWAHRDDLTDRLDEFIAIVEARLNRNLRVRAMEATLGSTALVDGALTLPADFLAFKELRYDGSPGYTLEPRPIEWIRSQAALADLPRYFAVTSTQAVCWPQTGSVKGTYYRSIPSLTANASNWLLTAYPDLYLYACLEEAYIYALDIETASVWAKKSQAILDQVQSSDNANALGGGPLQIRLR